MTPFLLARRGMRRLLFVALLLSAVFSLAQVQIDSLLAFYMSTGGPFWFNNANWNLTADPCAPPGWYGVICDPSKTTVEEFWFGGGNNNLTGTLPDLNLPDLFRM